MLIVTGGAGFIGSHIVRGLNRAGRDDIVVVDDMTDGHKYTNIVDCAIADYWDKSELFTRLDALDDAPDAVLHQGACAVTTEWDGRYMLAENYRYSVDLFGFCEEHDVPLIYASSAAIYGASTSFREDDAAAERPLNVYGYSKLLFDRYVRRRLENGRGPQVVGLRYFNVYGPGESFKGQMASVALHFHEQLLANGELRLFEGSHGYGDGEQRRDFVYVDDIVALNLWFLDHPERSGIFNAGTGASSTFNEVARAVVDWHGRGSIRYIEFPHGLRERYQSFTEADLTALRAAGYDASFTDVRTGVRSYLDRITAQ